MSRRERGHTIHNESVYRTGDPGGRLILTTQRVGMYSIGQNIRMMRLRKVGKKVVTVSSTVSRCSR